jgi:L-lactate dehydrogenase complex protein LldE
MRISVFQPCFIDQLLPTVGTAVVSVLERLGHLVECPAGQTCCGQPPFNAGYADDSRRVARHFLDVFDDAEHVVVPSGSCATMIKVFYVQLFEGTPDAARAKRLADATWEFSDFLCAKLGVSDVGARFDHTVTFHDGCHGLRELGIAEQPRRLLNAVRGLRLVEMAERRTCCGFGGTFAVKFADISSAMGQVKCQSAAATGAEFVVSNDSSCLMQIRGWAERNDLASLRTLHLAEVLASR